MTVRWIIPDPRAPMRAMRRIWVAEEGLTFLLGFLLVLCFVVVPLGAAGRLGPRPYFAVEFLFAGILVSGVFSLPLRPLARAAWLALLLGLLALRWAFLRGPLGRGQHALEAGVVALALAILAVLVLVRVLAAGRVTRQRIEGAIAVYLLFGMIWTQAFRVLCVLDPGAVTGVGVVGEMDHGARLLYFSFTTLTTTGYGDFLPANLAARSLANLEGLVGQLYPAILIARLVSLQISPPPAGPSGE